MNLSKEKEYVAFSREREIPVDAYTTAVIDAKLSQIKKDFENLLDKEAGKI